MSLDVQQFLNDSGGNFTETAPRPPVPGEENEQHSNCGASTRSSSSHKSHLSGKSHCSAKSVVSHQSEKSPAATPRRSNLDKSTRSPIISNKLGGGEDADAPLGFEPEGSAASSPAFMEKSTPYLKWAEDMTYLLNDSDGVKLFKNFLDSEGCSELLDFWFACKGLHMHNPPKHEKSIKNIIKLIYKKYIRSEAFARISNDIKGRITDKIKHGIYEMTIFDEAHQVVESTLRNDSYPQFLKSELYVQYVQNGGESPKSSNTSSESNSVRPISEPLVTVQEDKELRSEDIGKMGPPRVALTREALMITSGLRAETSRIADGSYPGPFKTPANPYHHFSQAFPSAQESEVQSSSDAHTDDTMSLTDVDSSVDGRDHKKWKQRRKMFIARNARENKGKGLNSIDFIPRTAQPASQDRNAAEKDPNKFAEMLIERLLKVQADREQKERDHEKMRSIEEQLKRVDQLTTDEEDPRPHATVSSVPTAGVDHQQNTNQLNTSLQQVMASVMAEQGEDNAQSILENHCSRIWDSSVGQTPTRQTPKSHSPDRTMNHSILERSLDLSLDKTLDQTFGARSLVAPGPTPNVSTTNLKLSSHKRTKDFVSTLSFDSGVCDDKSGVMYHSYHQRGTGAELGAGHHHHHHGHHDHRDLKSKSHHPSATHNTSYSIDSQQQQRRLAYNRSEPALRGLPTGHSHHVDQLNATTIEDHYRSRSRDRRTNNKKNLDIDIDSGVSLRMDDNKALPDLQNPSSEKVLNWMSANEKIACSSTTQYSTDVSDRSSSHKRSSHKSASSATPISHKHSGSKRSSSNSQRSNSLDRQNLQSILYSSSMTDYHSNPLPSSTSASALPGQLFVQDPNMPPPGVPDPTTQLEEAKRRLEDETRHQQMKKSSSYAGNIAGKGRDMPPPALPPRQLPVQKNLNTSHDLSVVEEPSPSSKSNERRRPLSSSSAPSTPATNQNTVVCYYFCDEPIPYRSTVPGKNINLAQFKNVISKRGSYKYFFKMACDDFESGMVMEEFTDDGAILPLWDGKIICKIMKAD